MAKLLATASCANFPAVRYCASMRVILIMPLTFLVYLDRRSPK
jgi:hypothetical protein